VSKPAIEVITSVERRRRWSTAEKERLVAASLEHGTTVTAIAREAGIHPGQLYGWRRQLLRRRPAAAFAAVQIAAGPAAAASPASGLIEVEFANGSRMRISGAVDPATLGATVAVLATGPLSTLSVISPAMPGSCRPMRMPGSTGSTTRTVREGRSRRRVAGRMAGASSSSLPMLPPRRAASSPCWRRSRSRRPSALMRSSTSSARQWPLNRGASDSAPRARCAAGR
jgi:transposase